jgi:8-oxo-dGTP diphosphatase
MSKTQTIAIILKRADKFLLGKRSPTKSAAPNYWCPISGKIEDGETQSEAVIREAKEEIGVVVKPIRKITEFDIDDRRAVLHWWLVELVSGEPRICNDENSELRWVSVIEMHSLEPIFSEDIQVFQTITD